MEIKMNLSAFFTEGSMTLEIVVWSLFAGVILALLATLYNKRILGAFVRKLLTLEAVNADSAKTLGEVGYGNSKFVYFALRKNGGLRNLVVGLSPETDPSAEAEEIITKSYKLPSKEIPLSKMKFFIPEDKISKAEYMYSADGSNVLFIILAIVLLAVVATLVFTLAPDLIIMAKNTFGIQ